MSYGVGVEVARILWSTLAKVKRPFSFFLHPTFLVLVFAPTPCAGKAAAHRWQKGRSVYT
jgi:hypothetical protein